MAVSAKQDINLLLIGKTGNGKSALGNSILRRAAFKSSCRTTSVTTDIAKEETDFNGRRITVVDGPGVGDTRVDNELATCLVLNAMCEAVNTNPQGFHALLLVVKFGGRFTNEDKVTVEFLKKVFGNDSVRLNCVLIITHGDDFEKESEESGEVFSDWCALQQGVFHELMIECSNRVLLIDNRTKDKSKQEKQLQELIQIVDGLGNLYTEDQFTRAMTGRVHLLIEVRKPQIATETEREIEKISKKLDNIDFGVQPERRICLLDAVYLQAEELLDTVTARDAGSGLLEDEKTKVTFLRSKIVSKY